MHDLETLAINAVLAILIEKLMRIAYTSVKPSDFIRKKLKRVKY